MPEICVNQRTPEWHAARLGKITSSLAAACLRIGPKSAQKAWREITGNQTEAEKRHALEDFNLRYGQNFEAVARNAYEAQTGNIVTECGFFVHPEVPWLGASPDGLVDADGLVEVKCPLEPYPSVPHHYRIQCLIQLACTGRAWCDFFVWPKPPQQPQLWRIHRSGGIVGLVLRLKRFYDEFVVTGTVPPRRKAR